LAAEVRFVDLRGEPLTSLPEWESAWIVFAGAKADLLDTEVYLQEQSLPLQWHPASAQMRTLWEKRGPGRYWLRVYRAGCLQSETLLEVWPQSWGPEGLLALWEDLHYLLPLEWGQAVFPGKAVMGGELNVPAPLRGWQQEFALLQEILLGQQAEKGLLALLAVLKKSSRFVLKREPQAVSLHQARKPLLKSYWQKQRVWDQRSRLSIETAENQKIKAGMVLIENRVRFLKAFLQQKGQAKAVQWLDSWLKALYALRFEGWESLTLQGRTPTVFTRDPLLLSIFKQFRRLQAGFSFSVSAEGPQRALENLPDLYQIWTACHLVSVLTALLSHAGFTLVEGSWFSRWENTPWYRVFPRGQSVLAMVFPRKQISIQVWSERQFGAKGEIYSISYAQRPDLLVELRRVGRPPQLWLWDAKYRQASAQRGPEKEDLDRMHAYRDALRDRQGHALVTSATIFYPGPSRSFGEGLDAIQADPLQREAFQKSLKCQLSALVLPLLAEASG